MLGEEIAMEIDATLDQLIRNAEVFQKANLIQLSEAEIEGFQKTQESLIQHLIHMDQHLENKRKELKTPHARSASARIQEKKVRFEKLKSAYNHTLSKAHQLSILSKRRTKRFLAVD